MNKKFFSIVGAGFFIVAVSTFVDIKHKTEGNRLFSDNIEALANSEHTTGKAICYSQFTSSENSYCLVCVQCDYVRGVGAQKGGYCKW